MTWWGTSWVQHNEKMQYNSMPSQLLMHRQCCDLSDPRRRTMWSSTGLRIKFFWRTLASFLFSPEHHSYQAACVQLQHLGCDILAAAQNLCYQIPPASLMSAPTDLCLLANVSKLHCQAQHIILQSYLRQKIPLTRTQFNFSGLREGKARGQASGLQAEILI